MEVDDVRQDSSVSRKAVLYALLVHLCSCVWFHVCLNHKSLLFTPSWVWLRWAHGQTGQNPSTRTGPVCRGSSRGWRLAEWTEWRSARGWLNQLLPHPHHQSPSCFSELDTHWKSHQKYHWYVDKEMLFLWNNDVSVITHYFHRCRFPAPPAVIKISLFWGKCLTCQMVDLWA